MLSLVVTAKNTSSRCSDPYTCQTARTAQTMYGTALEMQAPTMHESLPNFTSGNTLLDTNSSPRFTARSIDEAKLLPGPKVNSAVA